MLPSALCGVWRERLAGVAREISELLGKCASSVKRILLQRSMLPWCRLAIYCASVLCSNPSNFLKDQLGHLVENGSQHRLVDSAVRGSVEECGPKHRPTETASFNKTFVRSSRGLTLSHPDSKYVRDPHRLSIGGMP